MRICTGAIRDQHRIITIGFVDVDEAGALWRPGGEVGALAKKCPWSAAYQVHEQQGLSVRGVKPNRRTISRKTELPYDEPAGRQRRKVPRQIGKHPGAHLAQPDVKSALLVREEGHELPVWRNFSAFFRA